MNSSLPVILRNIAANFNDLAEAVEASNQEISSHFEVLDNKVDITEQRTCKLENDASNTTHTLKAAADILLRGLN